MLSLLHWHPTESTHTITHRPGNMNLQQIEVSPDNWKMARLIVRGILGVLFLVAGYWKVFTLTPTAHAEQFFLGWFADSWIPHWLLWTLGITIPYLEFTAGILLCIGLRVRDTAFALGLLLIVTTYGHALREPLFNIDGHTFTRLSLVLFLLITPGGPDWLSVDYWLARKSRNDEGGSKSRG